MVTIAKIRETLKDIDWDIDVRLLKDNSPLSEQGLDSLDMLDLLLCLEQGYSIKIPDEDLNQLRTLNDFVAYINRSA